MTYIELPFPPSSNTLYPSNRRTGRRFKSQRYEDWIRQANAAFHVFKPPTFSGPVMVRYKFGRPDKRRRDLESGFKAVSDSLVWSGVLDDDSQIHEIHASWGGKPGYVEIEILPLQNGSE